MNFHNFIVKLRALSDKNKKIILWTIVVILTMAMGYFWVKGAMNNLQKLGENINQIKLPEIQTPATEIPNEQTLEDQTAE